MEKVSIKLVTRRGTEFKMDVDGRVMDHRLLQWRGDIYLYHSVQMGRLTWVEEPAPFCLD